MSDCCFLAGAAKADITPKVGTLLYGYRPDSVSTSVHDPLEATAVMFRQGDSSSLLISLSVGDLGTPLADELRIIAGKAAGIDPARVIISATHTHSAPNVSGMEGWGDVDRPYVDNILIPALKECTAAALASLAPSELAFSTVRSEVGINRRQQFPNGFIGLGQNPWGCFDPTRTLIAIRRKSDRKGVVNMLHYGCHGTAAGDNREITRDWPGVMTDRLEKETGVLTGFWNGAIGDVGPRLSNGQTTGNISYVEELGAIAGEDAVRAYKALGEYSDGLLKVIPALISLPRKPLPPYEDARAALDSYKEPEKLINISRLTYSYYKAVCDEYAAGCPDYEREFTYPAAVVAIGEAVFVPFPFEIFSEISMRLRAYSPFPHTLCLSNANGYNAYLPSQDQLVRGGYEVACFRFSDAHPLADNSDQLLIDRNLAIIAEMLQK